MSFVDDDIGLVNNSDLGVDRFFVLLSGSVSVHLAHKRRVIGGPVVPVTPPAPPTSSIYVADGTKVLSNSSQNILLRVTLIHL
jgi:hypothetical protein